jgi:uncharacterized membrane protein (GlpM family)
VWEYIWKFFIGGLILVLATYFSKSKNIFLAGIITTLPIMTLANLMLQIKYLDAGEFQQAQKSGIFGALGLALFIFGCYLFTTWVKPVYAILLSLAIYFLYFVFYKYFA